MQGKAHKTWCPCHRLSIISHHILITLVVFHSHSTDLCKPQVTLSSKVEMIKKIFAAASQHCPNVTQEMDMASPPRKESSKTVFYPKLIEDRQQDGHIHSSKSCKVQVSNMTSPKTATSFIHQLSCPRKHNLQRLFWWLLGAQWSLLN